MVNLSPTGTIGENTWVETYRNVCLQRNGTKKTCVPSYIIQNVHTELETVTLYRGTMSARWVLEIFLPFKHYFFLYVVASQINLRKDSLVSWCLSYLDVSQNAERAKWKIQQLKQVKTFDSQPDDY